MWKAMNSLKKNSASKLIIILLLFSLLNICAAAGSFYIPNPPTGITSGGINIDYEYTIATGEVGSNWKFDWGDGTYSDWIEVEESDASISQTHSWSEYGTYNVRVKHRSIYLTYSPWSDSLVVTISEVFDTDGDGWSNQVEDTYGTDPDDPNDYPLDTDGDGTPDSTDEDDDNDGLTDIVEGSLGSNSKTSLDVTPTVILGSPFYFVDTDYDGNSDLLYILETGKHTEITIQDGKMHLDIDADGGWDYTYKGGLFTIYEPFPWLTVIIATILIILLVVILLFKTGVIFLYEEEYVVEE